MQLLYANRIYTTVASSARPIWCGWRADNWQKARIIIIYYILSERKTVYTSRNWSLIVQNITNKTSPTPHTRFSPVRQSRGHLYDRSIFYFDMQLIVCTVIDYWRVFFLWYRSSDKSVLTRKIMHWKNSMPRLIKCSLPNNYEVGGRCWFLGDENPFANEKY